jgi:hypothetical protein
MVRVIFNLVLIRKKSSYCCDGVFSLSISVLVQQSGSWYSGWRSIILMTAGLMTAGFRKPLYPQVFQMYSLLEPLPLIRNQTHSRPGPSPPHFVLRFRTVVRLLRKRNLSWASVSLASFLTNQLTRLSFLAHPGTYTSSEIPSNNDKEARQGSASDSAFCSLIWVLQNEWLFLSVSARTLLKFHCLPVPISYQIS